VPVQVAAKVNIAGVVAAFGRMSTSDYTKVFREARKPARHDQADHAKREQAPTGRWPGLAPSTLERRTRARGRSKSGRNRNWPTKLLGRFPGSLRMMASSKHLIVRSRVKRFSWIHQAGGVAGHGARIPARQYLWISTRLKKDVTALFRSFLLARFRGRTWP
jgi:phage gpG-like protein